MRKIIVGIAAACCLVASLAPAFACPYTQANAGRAPQQTAAAEDTTTAR